MKKTVGIVLLLSILAYAAITIIGTQKPLAAGLLFFIVIFSVGMLAVFIYRRALKGDLAFILLEILIICGSVSAMIGGASYFQDMAQSNQQEIDALSHETEVAAADIEYYSEYIDYLNGELERVEQGNDDLAQLIEEEKNKPLPVIEPAPEPEPEIVYEYYEEEDDRNYYDDDEHEEDDDD